MRRSNKIVYCARNLVNNKSYIGWCCDFGERKARHIRESELGSNTRFHNAIRKYGPSCFEWTILFDNLNSFEDCKRMEVRMIALFDTYTHGYNATLGGDGGYTGVNSGQFKKGNKPWDTGIKFSDSHRAKLSIAQTGKKQPIEQVQKRAEKLKGRTYSAEHRQKISLGLQKPIGQYDLNGKLIAQFPSLNEATALTGVTNISAVCHGRFDQAGGFKWKLI